MTASTSSLVIGCSGFLFLPVPVLVICGFPEMHPFLLDCLIYWHIAAHFKIICISLALVVISPLSFMILLFKSFFFLTRLANGLSTLFILSKNQLLVLLICSTVLLVSISLSSSQIFTNSLLLLGVGFICCSFSSSFRCEINLCILSCFFVCLFVCFSIF